MCFFLLFIVQNTSRNDVLRLILKSFDFHITYLFWKEPQFIKFFKFIFFILSWYQFKCKNQVTFKFCWTIVQGITVQRITVQGTTVQRTTVQNQDWTKLQDPGSVYIWTLVHLNMNHTPKLISAYFSEFSLSSVIFLNWIQILSSTVIPVNGYL